MDTCSVETGLLRKKPCGARAVTHCQNCEQPLCNEHAVPQLTEGGSRTGKFMCKDCLSAIKSADKGLAAAARVQEQRKDAAAMKAAMETIKSPPAMQKKPAAAQAEAPKEEAPAAKPEESKPLEFTPSKGKPK